MIVSTVSNTKSLIVKQENTVVNKLLVCVCVYVCDPHFFTRDLLQNKTQQISSLVQKKTFPFFVLFILFRFCFHTND